MVEEDDLISELLSALIMLYIGLVITLIIVNNFVLQRTWRPFYRLLEQLSKFRLERPSAISREDTRVEEFRLLQDTIQKVLQSNINSYSSQKQFIENAAHELQTPLAISINKLEAIASSEQLSENETTLLSGALDNLDRLSRLNRSLLLLTRIENRQYNSGEDINMNELTHKLVDDFSELRLFRNIDLAINEEADCVITINQDLAAMLLTNLIKNAIIHTNQGGRATITIRSRSWSLSNTSDGTALDQEQIFTRFYKQDASSSSTGLGLSIASAIADLYGFRIAYTHEGMHCFTIYF
jgi:signal transduction histidine kinase